MPTYTPLVRQATDFSCGPAALASCLYYWGVWDGRESELYPLLGTTCDGTNAAGIMRVAEGFGLTVEYKNKLTVSDLKDILAAGWTAILNVQAWGKYDETTNFGEVWDDGHYVVLANLTDSDIVMMDPSVAGRYAILSIAQFDERWHDWNDEGSEHEFHTAILLRGQVPMDLSQPLRIDRE
jgi:uncharacterized protein